jgi:hypothetical protein
MNRLLALTLTFVVLTLTGGVLAGSEELCGTWINMDYAKEGNRSTKVIFNSNGKFEEFRNVDSKFPHIEGTYKITEKWTDSEGNIFYKSQAVNNWDRETKSLHKLSQSGKILEFVWAYDEYPTDVTPRPLYYHKYFRE